MANAHSEIKNPGTLKSAGNLPMIFTVCAVIGIASFALGLTVDAKRAWAAFLLNHFYFLSLSLGGLFIASLHWLTNAMWSAPVRRVSEAFTSYLPVVLIAFIILIFGMHHLYLWTDPAVVSADPSLAHKSAYLNSTAMIVRDVVFIILWNVFAWKMVGNSVAQDANGDIAYTNRNKAITPLFLIVFALSYTFLSFDHLMSLDPHWFSTMFGVYCFAGMFSSSLALTTIVTIILKRRGLVDGIVNENHLHDLGKYMFAFTIFWAYIGFSQFMLIWYANLPEETMWYMHRLTGGWMGVSIFLLVGKFLFPFFYLLPREAKRSEKRLLIAGSFMLIAQWIDFSWIIQPEFFKNGPTIGWMELGMLLGFGGIFGLCVIRFFRKNCLVAIRDPRLEASVFHHHQ